MVFFYILIALFLAMNVGANNTAAEMGAAYGSGIRTRKEAITLIAIFVILGAIISGSAVMKTLGAGTGALVGDRPFKLFFYVIFVFMAVSAAFDFISSIFKVSIPTSYAIVSCIVAIGLYYNTLAVDKALVILKWWGISALAAFVAAFILGKILHFKFAKSLSGLKESGRARTVLGALLTFSGCFVAFAGGANGAAKAMGPLVAVGITTVSWGLLLGGAGIAAGALIFGKTALEHSDKEITEIGLVKAILIEMICGAVLLSASFNGIPVSVSVAVSSGLMGMGCADMGFFQSLRKHHFVRTCFIWLAVPVASMGLTYFLLHILSVILK